MFVLLALNLKFEKLSFYRDSYWPGGVVAEESGERAADVRQRLRMVTKAKMLGSIPGSTHIYIVFNNKK